MQLGKFSISLPVADLARSRAFYETLGFEVVGGQADQGWLVLSSGTTVIGLFQGMFDKPMLTFNPGWNQSGGDVEGEFMDVRAIQAHLEANGIELTTRTPEDGEGIGHITLVDPDGNPILIDQHR